MTDRVDAPSFEPGFVFAGRYRLVRPLGSGGMASVWEAVDVRRNETLAIKLLASALVASEEARARFEREARAVASVESPFVVRVMDHGVADGAQPYIVLERLVGRDLDEVLAAKPVLALEEVECIVRHVCGAIATAQRAGVVHRDIKPANIFVTGSGIETIAKLVDFGVAHVETGGEQARKLTRPDEILGTLEYISPEQLLGHGPVDGRADLYGLAVVAYRCLTGRVPYQGDTLGELLMSLTRQKPPPPSSLADGIPPSVDQWMDKALAQDRTKRFQTPEEMADRLVIAVRSFRAQGPASAPSPPAPVSSAHPPSRPVAPPARAEVPSWVDRAEAPQSLITSQPAARPVRDPAVLPSRAALLVDRWLSRLEHVAPSWMSPILRARGGSVGATLLQVLAQARQSFAESLVDHRLMWIGIAAVVGACALIVALFLVFG